MITTYNCSCCYCLCSCIQFNIYCLRSINCISAHTLRISSINLTVMFSGNRYYCLRRDRCDIQIAIYYCHFDVTIVLGCYYKIIFSQPHRVMARICSGCLCFCSFCKGYCHCCRGCSNFITGYRLLVSSVYFTIMISGYNNFCCNRTWNNFQFTIHSISYNILICCIYSTNDSVCKYCIVSTNLNTFCSYTDILKYSILFRRCISSNRLHLASIFFRCTISRQCNILIIVEINHILRCICAQSDGLCIASDYGIALDCCRTFCHFFIYFLSRYSL